MNYNDSFLSLIKPLTPIITAIGKEQGTCYAVGGCVRDLVLEREIKDLDIEVHNITLEKLEAILKLFGTVKLVGKKFGVLRLHGHDVDWSLPRRDSAGRKPTVTIDPHLTIEQAAKRRDITMNAMAIDLNKALISSSSDFLIIDPYEGLKDIAEKKLRVIDDQLFLEDPLRFFRVMQFLARFDMEPDEHLNQLCSTMELYDTTTKSPLARERIFEEIKKLCLKSHSPSQGFRWLLKIGRLQEIFPELYALVGIKQRPDYHPEGDVFEHTMQALDAAARLEKYSSEEEKLMIMLATLCHDLGKATTTDENLQCIGHDKEGVPLAKALLKRITDDQTLRASVSKLVRHHLEPFSFLEQGAKPAAYKRLAVKLAPEVTMRQLGMLALVDSRGTNPSGTHEPHTDAYEEEYNRFLEKTNTANVLIKPEPPVLLGRDLMGFVEPGPLMGKLLKEAYDLQIKEGIQDAEELKRRVLKK